MCNERDLAKWWRSANIKFLLRVYMCECRNHLRTSGRIDLLEKCSTYVPAAVVLVVSELFARVIRSIGCRLAVRGEVEFEAANIYSIILWTEKLVFLRYECGLRSSEATDRSLDSTPAITEETSNARWLSQIKNKNVHEMMTVKCKWRLTEKLASIFMALLLSVLCFFSFASICILFNSSKATWCKLQPVFHFHLTFDDIWVGFLTQFYSLVLLSWIARGDNVAIESDTIGRRMKNGEKKIYWFLKMCLKRCWELGNESVKTMISWFRDQRALSSCERNIIFKSIREVSPIHVSEGQQCIIHLIRCFRHTRKSLDWRGETWSWEWNFERITFWSIVRSMIDDVKVLHDAAAVACTCEKSSCETCELSLGNRAK